MKHLKLFNTQAEFDAATLELPNVSYIEESDTVHFSPYVIDYSSQYLTFTALEDSAIGLTDWSEKTPIVNLQYSKNNGEWVTWDYSDISLSTGDTLRFKGNNPTGLCDGNEDRWPNFLTPSGMVDVSGNIMSLLYGDNFIGKTDLTDKVCAFAELFGETNVVNARDLKLPATTLAESCYSGMFYGCQNLTTAPELPATTLADSCYASMFNDCTSLTTAPELPATTLADSCYSYIFEGCSNLNYIKMLATDISASYCLSYWVDGVASTGTFIKHPDMTSLPSGINGIPEGWTVEDYGETNDPYNGHEYVDLGLPSGTLWATCNIGATTPEEHGDHFNWGETSPTTQMNDVCVTYDLSIDELKSRGIIDNNGRLTAEYDAATVTWGSDWRMPTRSEMQELLDNCTCQYTSTPPYLFQIVGPNGNSITMPNTHIAGGGGHYWSSDVSDYDSQAYELFFTGSYQYTESCDRAMENTIRPVRNN